VAEAQRGGPGIEPPAPPTLAEAEDAQTRHVRFGGENFSECFSCGVRPEDGLCIHVGPVAGSDLQAAAWTAREVSPEVVWAAIDCPGAYAVGGPGRGEVVLGRMAAEIRRLPEEGERCVVAAWPLGEDGRKLYAGTALFSAEGELLAFARQTWIAPKPDMGADSN
jgi:predicted amidohydrolase